MKIKVCKWKTCTDRFSEYISTRLVNDKIRLKLENIEVEDCLCLWQCKMWPNIVIDWNVQNYMNPAKASELAMNKKTWKKKRNNTNKKKK